MSYISLTHSSKSKCYFKAKPSAYYFYVKTKITADFQICISVPLTLNTCTEAVARRCSIKSFFVEKLAKFTGKHLCQSFFFDEVAGLSLQLY